MKICLQTNFRTDFPLREPRAHKWMIEHCLRASNLEVIGHMLKSNHPGL